MDIKRVGMVIGLRDDQADEYRALHANDNPGVRDLLVECGIRNFSIYLQRMPDGVLYLFGYYEYHGSDYEADQARLTADPRNRDWLTMTDPMQIPLPGEQGWKIMQEVYYNA